MSDQAPSTSSPLKVFLGMMGVFVFFGFLVLILSGYAGHDSIEDRAYMGEFDADTIQQRWANLEEIDAAQAELLDEEKVKAAMASLAEKAPAAKKSSVVVPGSPTFLKQMEAASAPEPEAVAKPEPKAKTDPKALPATEKKAAPKAKPASKEAKDVKAKEKAAAPKKPEAKTPAQ